MTLLEGSLNSDPTGTFHYLTLWKPTVFQRLRLPSSTGNSRFPTLSRFDSFFNIYAEKITKQKAPLAKRFLLCEPSRGATLGFIAPQSFFSFSNYIRSTLVE